MRIICSQCQTRFRVDDKYMTARGVRVQCPRCAHIELIEPAAVEADAREEERDEALFAQENADVDFADLQSELQEEVEGLTNQHTPPYEFEGLIRDFPPADNPPSATSKELPLKRGIGFWLLGWGVAVFFVLLFLVIFFGR